MNVEQLIAKELARQAGVSKWVSRLQSRPEVEKRFWSKVTRRAPDECWPWHACKTDCEYGQLTHKNKHWKAHRFAYWLTHGNFDFSLDVLHKCDNPSCCNPKHLELGTAADNIRQAYDRGRKIPVSFKGKGQPNAVLTAEQVLEIRRLRSLGVMLTTLSKHFGTSPTNIYRIATRRAWTHI